MSPHLLPLHEATDPTLSGGKAVNLAAMLRAGLPVPDGFVVTTTAYHSRGENDSIPAALTQEILQAYESMGRPLVAARSSATAEDLAGASMAGQYQSFLNLSTPEALLTAISKCWVSIRNDRVKSYLAEQGIPLNSVAMAVVVQRLVPADVAGVLFTTNPRTADPAEMLIEASWGLGESVVSGDVQPDIIRIATTQCEILDYSVADKQTRLLPGALSAETVPAEQRQRACLDYSAIQELCRLGQRAAQHFGCPQDIEWAISGGKVFLLQSRAITTLDDAAAYQSILANTRAHLESELDAGRGPWVRHNLDETLHNPTPLTWDVVRRFMSGNGGFGQMYRSVGFEPATTVAQEGFLELIGAGIYMDCSRSPQMFAEGFPFTYDIALLRANPDAAQQPPTLPTGKFAARTAASRTATKVTAKLHEEAKSLDSRFDQDFVPTLLAWCLTEEKRDLTSLDSASLITLWRDRESKIMGDFGAAAFLPSMIEAMAAADLHSFLTENIWDEDPEELIRILGVSTSSDCTLKANAELREVALATRSIDAWLADHGHRAPGEFDLATPRWSERPSDLFSLAAPLKDSTDPTFRHHQRTVQAEECLQLLKASLSSSLATELEARTRLLQRYSRFREDGKYYLMRAYTVLRHTALEFSRRLNLTNAQEIFYLTTEEIFTALHTGFVPQDRIARRRATHRVAEKLYIPRVVDREDLPSLGTPNLLPGAEQWSAHPVSCGSSTGPAKTVLRPESAVDLGTSYVLICPSTDPSWTPLFANAAALVLERGGTLSHGAIVAREMGLPAVVLENATSLFKDGEPLTIDANSGSVSRSGATSSTSPHDPTNALVERRLMPPPVSPRERNGVTMALIIALAWSAFIAAFYLLPPTWLRDPVFRLIDFVLWPLIAKFGYVGGVAIIGACFSLMLLLGQKFLTENSRLFTAKLRAAKLRKLANDLPSGSPRRLALEKLAAPVSTRILKAAMIPLGFLLGPLTLVFLWFPERVDPAVWNAAPGTSVNIIAEIDGDFTQPVTLTYPPPLSLEPGSEATQSLPEIRRELEDLRAEWQTGSDLNAYPWEVQAAAEHAKDSLLSSLDAFLRSPIPTRKISWRLRIPETSGGRFTPSITLPGEAPQEFPIVFGISQPPAAADFTNDHGSLRSLSVQYPRPLTQRTFWAPFKSLGGPTWDFGWLGVYLLSYLIAMFAFKTLLGIP